MSTAPRNARPLAVCVSRWWLVWYTDPSGLIITISFPFLPPPDQCHGLGPISHLILVISPACPVIPTYNAHHCSCMPFSSSTHTATTDQMIMQYVERRQNVIPSPCACSTPRHSVCESRQAMRIKYKQGNFPAMQIPQCAKSARSRTTIHHQPSVQNSQRLLEGLFQNFDKGLISYRVP